MARIRIKNRTRPARRALGSRLRRGRLRRDQKGQASVEFLCMFILALFVVLIVMEVAFLGVDLLITRYGSFIGARGYLAGEPQWKEGAEMVGGLVVCNTGNINASATGQGVRLNVEIEEFFPLEALFGQNMRTTLYRETILGEPEKAESGDNTSQGIGGGF